VANADILAIDLSQSSLAYAKRMSVEYEINNIRFAQADLLTLGDYGEQFDMIECSGVLHHLEDPIAGWRVLTGLLKSTGFMKIAVYSEVARQHVVAARELIQKRELPATAEGIRACRALIMNLPANHPARGVIQFEDFFAMPHCRDLLFHVQEHRFTIPLIQTVLKELKLEFLGFTFGGQPVGKITRNRAILDNNLPVATSLADWHNHELNNPDIFSGMYQFWVFKS
jgi:SAM-dependent methyltransferase